MALRIHSALSPPLEAELNSEINIGFLRVSLILSQGERYGQRP